MIIYYDVLIRVLERIVPEEWRIIMQSNLPDAWDWKLQPERGFSILHVEVSIFPFS